MISFILNPIWKIIIIYITQSKNSIPRRGEYNVYSTFQSHEPEFDYLKSLEIEEKINKIRWLKRKNPAHFLLSTNDKTIKLWKVSERDKRVEGYNTKEENGAIRDPACITALRVSITSWSSEFVREVKINNNVIITRCLRWYKSNKAFDILLLHLGANHKTNGVDGRSITKENIRQCAHLSHKQYKCQQWSRDIPQCWWS